MKLWIALSCTLVAAAPAAAQVGPPPVMVNTADHERTARLVAIIKDAGPGREAETLAQLEPLLKEYDTAYGHSGNRFYCTRNADEATAYFDLVPPNQPNSAAEASDTRWCDALWLTGIMLVKQGQFEAALVPLERAVSMAPKRSRYLNRLGYTYLSLGNLPKAFEAFTRALDGADIGAESHADSEKSQAQAGMAIVLAKQGKRDEALALVERAIALQPGDEDIKKVREMIEGSTVK